MGSPQIKGAMSGHLSGRRCCLRSSWSILFKIFAGKTLKLEKVFPTFTTFSSCSPLPTVATDERKTF